VVRRQQGSQRRRQAVARRANAQQPLPRQRRDFHHQQARQVVEADDVIHAEDLRVAHLVQTHHRATSIRDAGWRALLALLACKAASAGKRVPAAHPALTSQACSEGGALVQ
jgi:putative transposase